MPQSSQTPSTRDELIQIVARDPQSAGGDEVWATDLVDAYRTENLREAIEAARGEYLTDNTGDESDDAYNRGVADAIAAIDALIGGA